MNKISENLDTKMSVSVDDIDFFLKKIKSKSNQGKRKKFSKKMDELKIGEEMVVPLTSLRCGILGGGWQSPDNVVFNRYMEGNLISGRLRVGDLVSETQAESAKIFEVMELNREKEIAEIIRTPFRIEYNGVLSNHSEKIATDEVSEYKFVPKGSAINLVIDAGFKVF